VSKISLVGGGGYIGKALSSSLTLNGHEVSNIQRDEFINSSFDYGHVIYCSGVTGGDFKVRLHEIVDAHVSHLSKMLQVLRCESFVYLSSARIYENQVSATESSKIYCDPLNISDCYNLSKLLGESIVMNSQVNKPSVARISYVVDGVNDHFFGPLLHASSNEKVVLNGHPETKKDFIMLSDVVSCLENIALRGKSEIYNVATGVNIRFEQLKSLIEKSLNRMVTYNSQSEKRTNPDIEISKVVNEFGFKPRSVLVDIEKSIIANLGQRSE
jgi:nucleoside-diphosphate-sugar epimerase